MSNLRWGADAPSDSSAARERLIDAAESCFQRYGVVKTTVEDVAASARVSRATVYRYFEGRDAIILAVLMREASRFLTRLRLQLAAEPSLEDAVITGVIYTVRTVRTDENLALLFAPESAGITGSVAGASEALFAITAEFLRPFFERAQQEGRLRQGIDLDDAAEWTLRAILSLLTVAGPKQRTDDELEELLANFLVPVIVSDSPASGRASDRSSAGAAG